ncbi:hypothetical protein DDB_G0274345 [Dictyostelium discoideum AX4]|uniref:Band 7 domain-containing protein n=1 Tax=Dictyostelium discoideum TaxID=44689 RepID=Q86IY7_DICDI|nr:hypothetical protein DDB_G0274345 [Dictyostelium discoideum AX4]EAL70065.1 hypothetical protein DDB_G0274345 [Dictyostelium discoideum AX4]|eukprot:XP_643928.1 hypothetical protein DDB_G0274345 [Dictyostelium discoideum AX4]
MNGADISLIVLAGFVGFIVLIIILNLFSKIFIVEKGTCVIVERFGKFHKKCDAGIHVLVPFIDEIKPLLWRYTTTYYDSNIYTTGKQNYKVTQKLMYKIDTRESLMDFPLQSIITRDNVKIKVHPMLLYRIVDPIRAVYEVYDLALCVEKLVQTSLRSIIGDMGLDDTLASREEINKTLMLKISSIFLNFGFKLEKVEILEILPSQSIQDALHLQISSERVRRANVISAEGFREQTKTEAEGDCQAQISLSRGRQQVLIISARAEAESKIIEAQAEADSIKIIGDALKEFNIEPTQYIIGTKYITTLISMAKKSKSVNIGLPYSSQILGSVKKL